MHFSKNHRLELSNCQRLGVQFSRIILLRGFVMFKFLKRLDVYAFISKTSTTLKFFLCKTKNL